MKTNQSLKTKCLLISHAAYVWNKRISAHPYEDEYAQALLEGGRDIRDNLLVQDAFRMRLDEDISDFIMAVDSYDPYDLRTRDRLQEVLGELFFTTSAYVQVQRSNDKFTLMGVITRLFMRLCQPVGNRRPFYGPEAKTGSSSTL